MDVYFKYKEKKGIKRNYKTIKATDISSLYISIISINVN